MKARLTVVLLVLVTASVVFAAPDVAIQPADVRGVVLRERGGH